MFAPLLLSALLGAVSQAPDAPPPPQAPAGVTDDGFKPDPAWKPLDGGKAVWFDPRQRRLIVRARVCLREGVLEHLLCLEQTKEHEAILATVAPPKMIHAGLLLTGASTGHPVRYRPKFEPPAGDPIRIDLEWVEGGKTRRADARSWVRDQKTRKPLEAHWVFAGSTFIQDPETRKTIYQADGGDLITVANFPSAILDVPFASSQSDAERNYEADTPRIPPRNTPVTMILRPANPKPAATP